MGTRGTHKIKFNVLVASRCDVCNYLTVGDRFSSHATGTSYTVNHSSDSNSRNIIVYLNYLNFR